MENKLQTNTQPNNNGLMMLNNCALQQLTSKMQSVVAMDKTLRLMFNDEQPVMNYKTHTQIAFLQATVIDYLATITGMLNVGKNLSAPQISLLAEMIIDDAGCKELNPSEIRECLLRGVKGEFGKLYDRIDVAVVFEWFEKYLDERTEKLVRFRTVQNSEFKSLVVEPVEISETGNEVLQKIKQDLEKKFKGVDNSNKILYEPKPPTDAQKLTTALFNEFDALLLTSPVEWVGEDAFIEYNGKMVNRYEYHNIRFEENRK